MSGPIAAIIGVDVQDGKRQTVSVSSFGNKVVGLYFSAHWCGPCRAFTPKLAEFYKKMKDKLEIVFLSSDQDEKSWAEYFAEMPWLALPYEERDLKETLSVKYKISGIPTLVLLDGATGETINFEADENVSADPEGKKFPWRTQKWHKPINLLIYFIFLCLMDG